MSGQGGIGFLGLAFEDRDAAGMAALLAARAATAPFAYLVTPNADHFVRLHRAPALLPLYEAAAWRTLDSRAVAQTARLLRLRPPPVATGADVLACLLDQHLRPGDRLTVIGLAPEGVRRLRARLPLCPVAHHAPPMGLAPGQPAFAQALAFARRNPARFTLLALGSPVQEQLAAGLAAGGGATGAGLCIGAGLEFWTGLRRRAPRALAALGLEWAWRLGQEPRRLARRYLRDDPAILALLLHELWRNRVQRGACWPADRPL